MNEDKYYIKISPEVIQKDIFAACYCTIDGQNETSYVYSGMSELLSGGTNGASLLKITVPLLFRQTAVDCGYYSVFDGALLQADVVKNFVFSATTSYPNRYYFYNTSDILYKNYLELSTMSVDWGDGSTLIPIASISPNYIYHDYASSGTYTITLIQKNPWGINTVKKTVTVPFTGTTIPNPNGTAYFTPNVGSWSATSFSYDYIFTGDSSNQVHYAISSTYVATPFTISGYTNSRITELKLYGATPYQLGTTVYTADNQPYGLITSITSEYTGYTVDSINYIDFIDGTTVYLVESNGIIPEWIQSSAIIKDEALLNVALSPEVQSDIFVERGKNSALERIQRLGEVDNIGEMITYGYGFFNFFEQQNLR